MMRQGSSSDVRMESTKIPAGYYAEIFQIAATIYTTKVGDYTTAKFINIGYIHNGTRNYLRGKDIGASDTVINTRSKIILDEGDSVFVEFEGTATSTKYEVIINGLLHKKIVPQTIKQ